MEKYFPIPVSLPRTLSLSIDGLLGDYEERQKRCNETRIGKFFS